MSSVQEKKSKIVFRNILIRQGSLDKIKCSAYSTLESMFPKKITAINILEDAMNSSRTFIQIPVLTVIIPSIQIFCVAMSILIKLIRNQKFAMGFSFEKLDSFITEFNQLKAMRQQTAHKYEVQQPEDKVEESTPTPKTNDCFEPSCPTITEKKTDRILIIASHMSIIFVYVQFSLLLYLIGLSTIKLGMMFLLTCVVIIGYLIAKISFFSTKSSHPTRRCSRRLKAVKQKLFGKAVALGSITCVLPQIKFNTCTGKFPAEKQKSL